MQIYIYSYNIHSGSASCRAATTTTTCFIVTIATTWATRALRGGRSRVEFCSAEKSNLLFAWTAALKIDVQQERSLRSEILWGFGLL